MNAGLGHGEVKSIMTVYARSKKGLSLTAVEALGSGGRLGERRAVDSWVTVRKQIIGRY